MDDPDALFLLPPEQFVAARDELAARMKQAGDRQASTAVKALRRPTVAAWAVNLAVRRAPEQLGELLALRTALVKAQRQILSGVTADLAGLTRQRRQLVEAMVAQAEEALADTGRDLGPHREEVRLTFEAAVADDEAASAVRAGRLPKALPAPAGFGTLAGLTAVPDGDAAPRRRPSGETAASALPVTDETHEPAAEAGGDDDDGGGEDAALDDAAARDAERDEQLAQQLAQARTLRQQVADEVEKALAHAREVERTADRLREEADRAAAEAGRRAREAEAAASRAAQADAAARSAREAADTAEGRAGRARTRAEEVQQQLRQADELIETIQA